MKEVLVYKDSDTEGSSSHTEKHHETFSVEQGQFLFILSWDMPRIGVYVCGIHKQFMTIIVDTLLWPVPFLQWERKASWVPPVSKSKSTGSCTCSVHRITGRYWLFYFCEVKGRLSKKKKQRRAQSKNAASENKSEDKHSQAQGTNKQEIWNSTISLFTPIASMFCLNEKLFLYTTNDNKERAWALESEKPESESHNYTDQLHDTGKII